MTARNYRSTLIAIDKAFIYMIPFADFKIGGLYGVINFCFLAIFFYYAIMCRVSRAIDIVCDGIIAECHDCRHLPPDFLRWTTSFFGKVRIIHLHYGIDRNIVFHCFVFDFFQSIKPISPETNLDVKGIMVIRQYVRLYLFHIIMQINIVSCTIIPRTCSPWPNVDKYQFVLWECFFELLNLTC